MKLVKSKHPIISCCLSLFFAFNANAQYEVNGNATQDNCNCYTLTEAIDDQSGSVWNQNKISLNNSFDYEFDIYLGDDEDGADGIAFVLQPISTSVGSSGGGMGYEGITPAVGITIDTYQNGNSNDPAFDHIAIQLNGDIDHSSPNNIDGPVSALASSPNIEDGQWHDFRITWNTSTTEMEAYVDGDLRVSTTIDMVNTVFSGDPEVFWGFTGSTGSKTNLQRFCTKNEADFNFNQTDSYCLGDTIDFSDNSTSFGHITNWYYDFGDGTTDTLTTQGDTSHLYTSAGNYTVTLKVKGNDGCVSDAQTISVDVYPNPVAAADVNTPICEDDSLVFEASGGGSYQWSGPNGFSSTQQNDTLFEASISDSGNYKLIATSSHGCTDTTVVDVTVNPRPSVDAGADTTICNGDQITLEATSNGNNVTYTWDNGLGAGASHTVSPSAHSTYNVIGENAYGCTAKSDVTISVQLQPDVSLTADTTEGIYPLPVNFSNTSNGASQYTWFFGDGTNNPTNDSIVQHTFENEGTYEVVLIGENLGCRDTANITITVLNPKMEYSFPNVFTPNGDGDNDYYHIIEPRFIKDLEIVILNRWGNLVFESNKIDFEWNGKVKNSGSKCTEGTYFYKAILTNMEGETVKEYGFIEVTLGK